MFLLLTDFHQLKFRCRAKIYCLLASLSILAFSSAKAQILTPKITPEISFSGLVNSQLQEGASFYHIDKWDKDRGLPRSGVSALAQSSAGYLWLGLERGIAKFDGESFVYYSPDSFSGLVDTRIQAILSDSKDRLWIGSSDSGSSVLINGEFSKIKKSSLEGQQSVNAFAETATGAILQASNLGIDSIGDQLQAQTAYLDSTSFGTAYRFAVDPVKSKVYSSNWEKAGLLQDGKLLPVFEAGTNRDIQSNNLFAGSHQNIWALSARAEEYGALHRLLPDGQFTPAQAWPFNIPIYKIGSFLEDTRQNLWISVLDDAVYRVGSDGIYERFDVGRGRVVALMEDQQGSIWAGSDTAGLFQFKLNPFQFYRTTSQAAVKSITTAGESSVLFTQGDQVYQADLNQSRFLGIKASYGVFEDSEKRVWAGNPGAIFLYQRHENGFQFFGRISGPGYTGIQTFFESEDQRVWIGLGPGGLSRFQGGLPKTILGSSSVIVTAMADDKDGEIWVGSAHGQLFRTEAGRLVSPPGISEFTQRKITQLYKDRDDSLWICTLGDGLFHWKGDRLFLHTKDFGLMTDEICSLQGTEKHIWIATTRGIARVPRQELQKLEDGLKETIQYMRFGKSDGLPEEECSSYYASSSAQTKDGRLWFATISGLISIDPESIPVSNTAPPVFIDRVWVDQRAFPMINNMVRVPPGSNRVTFQYTGISLGASHKTRFRYRLRNFDSRWIDAWNQREAHYTDIAPGDYSFEVQSANNNGGWSEEPATLSVIVEPFYWQTLSFKATATAIATILIGGIVWLALRGMYVGRIKEMERAQAVEKERSRLAADLHDRLGAETTQIIFQTGELIQHISQGNYSFVNQSANAIGSFAQDLVWSLDEIVWATNPSRDNSESSIAFITAYAENYLKTTNTSLRLDIPLGLERIQLSAEIRYQLFLAGKEALTNVIKHANAKTVWLRFRQENGFLILTVEDDGQGFVDNGKTELRHGLKNVKKRIESVGGAVVFKNNQNLGASVQLSVPLK